MPRFVPYLLVLAFAAWCGFQFRADLAQLSLAPALRSWDLVLLALFLSLLNYALRIVRWRWYLARLGYPLPPGFAALTFISGFAYTLSPAKVGEMVRARYYTPLGIPLSDVAAAFFAERFMDLIAMVLIAALLVTAASGYQGFVVSAAAGVICLLAALALVPWPALANPVRSARRVPRPLRAMLVGLISSLSSTRVLMRPAPLIAGFALGLVAWSLEGIGLGVLGFMFHPSHLEPRIALGIYGLAVLIGGLSFLPGGLGSTEAVMTALLVASGFPLTEALLLTLMCRVATLWFAVGLGWLAVLALHRRPTAMVTPWR